VAQDRDATRLRIARAGLTQTAVERVSRPSFGRMPITLVDRARAQLRRFFSDSPWTVEDDAGLSALVGPGDGWTEEELAPGIRLAYGWRGGNFKVEITADTEADASPVPVATGAAAIRAMAHVARPDLRLLFERALADKDACVRYYALRGLAQIGVARAEPSVERRASAARYRSPGALRGAGRARGSDSSVGRSGDCHTPLSCSPACRRSR
jgi:hypothetical protein